MREVNTAVIESTRVFQVIFFGAMCWPKYEPPKPETIISGYYPDQEALVEACMKALDKRSKDQLWVSRGALLIVSGSGGEVNNSCGSRAALLPKLNEGLNKRRQFLEEQTAKLFR